MTPCPNTMTAGAMRQFSDPTYQFVRSHSMKITSKRSGGEGGGEGSGSEGGGGNGGGREAGGGGLAANRTPRPDMLVPKASPIMSAHAPIDESCDRRSSAAGYPLAKLHANEQLSAQVLRSLIVP